MGSRLALEVKSYCDGFSEDKLIAKVSFVGHSLGGLIIRAAIPHLGSSIQNKLFTYLSMSSPHLGYMYNSNKLLDAGMWVMKNWKKSLCLTQLSMTDADLPEDTCLFKLAEQSGF